jgi:antitoxin YefM
VLLAKEDFDSLEETAYLLSSPENARRLLQALARRAEDRQAFGSIDELKHALGV